MCDSCDWTLTAPWWRWPKLGTPGRDVRSLPPALQMYDSSDPVSLFVKEPQTALEFGNDDLVHTLGDEPSSSGKRSSFSTRPLVRGNTRKVFLPSHKRFYLVVCELHCDTRGLPSVGRDQVCEAGMVLRRRKLSVAEEHTAQARDLLKTIGQARARIATIDRGMEKRVLNRRRRVSAMGSKGMMNDAATVAKSKVEVALNEAAVQERSRLTAELAEARAQLLEWKHESGATVLREGWEASDHENVGSWQLVDETPEGISEVIYPLYPLVADTRSLSHDAAGKTIWFGMLPTGSREVDFAGLPRFDAEWRYEVRCFVRHHHPECPKTGEPNDCGGRLVWSRPTEAFQLASHFDPVGTGNHPIAIQMPDIPSLAASVGTRLPVQMHFPTGSALQFKVEDGQAKDPSTNTAPQICFFSIPLITIVATFVLHLFLPIVVFVFQLWFLLGLKFCIPPSFSAGFSAGIDLSVKGKLALDAELDIAIDSVIGATSGNDRADALAADLNLALTGDASADLNGDGTRVDLHAAAANSPGVRMRDTFTNSFLMDLNESLGEDRTDAVQSGSIVQGLAFVQRVERAEVGA